MQCITTLKPTSASQPNTTANQLEMAANAAVAIADEQARRFDSRSDSAKVGAVKKDTKAKKAHLYKKKLCKTDSSGTVRSCTGKQLSPDRVFYTCNKCKARLCLVNVPSDEEMSRSSSSDDSEPPLPYEYGDFFSDNE